MNWIITIIVLLIIISLIVYVLRPKGKGIIGERQVRRVLNKLPKEYKVLNDIMFRTETGTTQLDHIVLSPKGIFIIETKNYSGNIYGDENSQYWTQVLYKTKNKLYNPILQNYGHVTAMKHLINKRDVKYHPIIVFGKGCKLNKIHSKTPVIYINKLKKVILNTESNCYINSSNLKAIEDIIVRNNITDKRERRNHIKYVNSKK